MRCGTARRFCLFPSTHRWMLWWKSKWVPRLGGRPESGAVNSSPGRILGKDNGMASAIATLGNGSAEAVLRDCVAALQRVAVYRLPPALDRRLLWLSENKERLTNAEREELLALVDFAGERTVDKLQAQATLQRLAALWPDLAANQP